MRRPKNCISVAKAKALQKNWNDTRALGLDTTSGFKEINAVTFNIDQLQEFIDYVKSESASQRIANPGIRVYFAAYNNALSDKATVFLNATENDGGNSANNYGIDPLNFGTNGWPPEAY
jgi:hypothetical protein|tara:strand:+ start:38 stop:394 length:357 start_codon:yes stop_codon:yes gene_type:complete